MAIHLTNAISFQGLITKFKVPKPVSLPQTYDNVTRTTTGTVMGDLIN